MKKIILSLMIIVLLFVIVGCEQFTRGVKDMQSSMSGLERVVKVYSSDGTEIEHYEGKLDIESTEYGNKVKFELNGKRVILFNATVVVEEK